MLCWLRTAPTARIPFPVWFWVRTGHKSALHEVWEAAATAGTFTFRWLAWGQMLLQRTHGITHLLAHLVGTGQKPVLPASDESPWGSGLAHSFSESLTNFRGNFLWQVHQLFHRAPASWKSEPRRQWQITSPSEKQVSRTWSLWVLADPYPPTLHIYLPIPHAGTTGIRTSSGLLCQLLQSCRD